MNKSELAQYLVNLIAIMESKESAGSARGNTLAQEYTKHYDLLTETIKKESTDGRIEHGSTGPAAPRVGVAGEARELPSPDVRREL